MAELTQNNQVDSDDEDEDTDFKDFSFLSDFEKEMPDKKDENTKPSGESVSVDVKIRHIID